MEGVKIPEGSKIEGTMLRIRFYVSVNSFNIGLKIKESSLTFHTLPKTLFIGSEVRSKLIKFGESSKDGRLSRIALEFDIQLVSLNPKF